MSYGCHVAKISHILPNPNKKRKTMLDAIKTDVEIAGLGCVQIFTQGPRNSHMSMMDYDAIAAYCTKKNINLYVHSSYITVGIFSINAENKEDKKSINAISNLINQLDACDKLKSKGFVVHLSKKTPDEIMDSLTVIIPLIGHYKTPLVFEQPAKKPDALKTYETPEKINNLTDMIMKKFPKFTNWYWCIDTCHLWSAGIELNKKVVVDKWFRDIKHPKKIGLFHLNGGSSDIFNTGKDKHIVPFSDDDDIWCDIFAKYKTKKINNIDRIVLEKGVYESEYKKSAVYPIMQFCKMYKIDSILEINRGEFKEINFTFNILSNIYK